MEIKVVLKTGEVLNMVEFRGCLPIMAKTLDGQYYLTNGFETYKTEGNVLLGEKVDCKSVDIHIER